MVRRAKPAQARAWLVLGRFVYSGGQARLADTGLARDQHDPAFPRLWWPRRDALDSSTVPWCFYSERHAEWKLSVVSGPRNHLYRTTIGLIPGAFRAGGEANHVGDFADELDLEDILAGADVNAIDEATKDLERLRSCCGVYLAMRQKLTQRSRG
jgi:hypothetical protein